MHALLEQGGRDGTQPWARLWAQGHGDVWREDAEHVERHRAALRAALHDGGQVRMRYAIGCDVALRLARDRPALPGDVHLVAPALLRSQFLTALYGAVRRGELTRAQADVHLDHLRSLRLRLLGDRVLQRVAWQCAEQLGWPDTLDAEYVAVARLQADALVTLDPRLAAAVENLVPLASWEQLTGG